ncbi:MAG: CotH kinase family protein, partial [Bacteroidales bacterium]|nr:CotH kinase family protein [Bacteroidales bacterium]
MKQYMYILFTCLLGLTTAGPARAQAVTDKQYAAAQTAITYEATYRIYTFFNGTKDGTVRYYLNTEGFRTSVRTNAGQFQFHMTEGDELYRSPGWRTDCYFTNPTLSNGSWGELNNDGHIHTNRELARNDWEGQVWYKEGSLFAVRSTNANTSTETWGAGSYWNALDENGDHVPEAGYTWEPAFIWRLEKVGEPDPEEPVEQKHVRLTNLPHVYIDTFNGRSISSKSYYVYARMWYVNEEDSVLFYDSLMIRGRGNSTWSLDKKPYKIKFQNKEKFLGKGYAKAKKWTLLANHGDKTLIRNALTNLLGERTGLKFNPAAKFVDLTINGEFVGNYQISDQIDVRPHRVNITEQDYPLQEESDITGGYLLEADDFGDFHTSKYWDYEEGRYLNPDGFYSRTNNVPIRIHYPEPEELETAQKDYIQQIVNEFEKRVAAINFRDAVKGYRSYVDSLSLANWYICTEISANVDGFWSAYFYKEQGEDKLYWGPLWDYDIAYNNDNRARNGSTNTTKQLMSDAGYGTARAWVARMWKDPWFQKLIYRRYSELVRGGLEDYLNAQIDSLVLLLDQSVKLNYERWSINTSTLRERVLYSTYDQYVSDLRTFLSQRIPYLKTTFAKL